MPRSPTAPPPAPGGGPAATTAPATGRTTPPRWPSARPGARCSSPGPASGAPAWALTSPPSPTKADSSAGSAAAWLAGQEEQEPKGWQQPGTTGTNGGNSHQIRAIARTGGTRDQLASPVTDVASPRTTPTRRPAPKPPELANLHRNRAPSRDHNEAHRVGDPTAEQYPQIARFRLGPVVGRPIATLSEPAAAAALRTGQLPPGTHFAMRRQDATLMYTIGSDQATSVITSLGRADALQPPARRHQPRLVGDRRSLVIRRHPP